MAIYTEATVNDTENLYTIFNYVNTTLDGSFFLFTLVGLWFIAFFGAQRFTRGDSMTAWIFASFINSIFAVFMALIGLLSPTYVYFMIILLAIGMLAKRLGKRVV